MYMTCSQASPWAKMLSPRPYSRVVFASPGAFRNAWVLKAGKAVDGAGAGFRFMGTVFMCGSGSHRASQVYVPPPREAVSHCTARAAPYTEQVMDIPTHLRILREFIAALDQRLPHVERAGEASIARDAAELKATALARIAELERELEAGRRP
jgi:hypothetical protein